MRYKAVVFDFDYTLANSEKGILLTFRHVLDKHGFYEISDQSIKETIGMTLENAFALLTGETNPEKLLGLRKEYVEKGNEVMTPNTFFYDGTIPLLSKIQEQGGKNGILSSKYRFRIMESFQKYKVEHLVDLVLGLEDLKQAKPDPEGIFSALRYFQIEKRELLYVGDNLIDAQTAQRAGVDFIGVLTGTTQRETFEKLPHVQIAERLEDIDKI